jgi:hypothetical protein
MAHFAKLGLNGKVLTVLTLNDSDMLNSSGNPDETVGQQYLELHNNWPSQLWIQTSYNTYKNTHRTGGTPFRGNYASIGGTWDEENQIFWPKKPYTSWIKHIPTASWKSPIGDAPALTEEQSNQIIQSTHKWRYIWNENNQTWELKNLREN